MGKHVSDRCQRSDCSSSASQPQNNQTFRKYLEDNIVFFPSQFVFLVSIFKMLRVEPRTTLSIATQRDNLVGKTRVLLVKVYRQHAQPENLAKLGVYRANSASTVTFKSFCGNLYLVVSHHFANQTGSLYVSSRT